MGNSNEAAAHYSQYSGSSLPSPGGGGDDSSSQHSLKTSRTTDSLLGTSLFSELDSQYSLPMRLQNYAMHGT